MEITLNKISELLKSKNLKGGLYSLPSGEAFSDLVAKLPHLEEETLIVMNTPRDSYLLMWTYRMEYVEYQGVNHEEHIEVCYEDLRIDKYLLESSFIILGKWTGTVL